jgi:membrane-associated phospholipid phosphatase
MILEKKNFKIDALSDIISSIPLTFYFTLIYLSIIHEYPNNLIYLIIFAGLMFTTITTDIIKRLPYPIFLWNITRRPEGAKNTDFLSKNGPAKKDAPGFPSGHMSATTFTLLICSYYFVKTPVGHITNITIIIAMMWSRWYKGVHNLFQIIGGIGYGSLCAYLTTLLI